MSERDSQSTLPTSNPKTDDFDRRLKGLIFTLRELADDISGSRAQRLREAIDLLDSFNIMHAERDRLRAALVSVQECISHQDFMRVRRIVDGALSDERGAHETTAPHNLAEALRLLRTVRWTLATNKQHPSTVQAIEEFLLTQQLLGDPREGVGAQSSEKANGEPK